MNLCIIPARKESKRIPGKNFREFAGRPIWQYSLGAAIESDLFDKIILAVDKPTLSASDTPAIYPKVHEYWRLDKNATDKSTLYDVAIEVLFAEHPADRKPTEWDYQYVCIVYPCAPFITPERLKEGYRHLQFHYDTVFPVQSIGYHIERTLRFTKDNPTKAEEVFARYKDENYNADTWRDYYKHAGQWFWCDVQKLVQNGTIIPENSGAIVLPWYEGQEIDTEEDWQIAEWKYKYWREGEGD